MTVRIGLVGCGLVAHRQHFPAYAATPGARVVAVASGRLESAKAAAERFDVPTVHARWEELVADTDVDAVDVCTPNALHAPVAIAAARAGKHVLVEKPMATSLADADAMIDAANQAGVVLAVAHNLRFSPAFREMKRVLPDIGAVFVARGVFMHSGPDESWGATSEWFWREELAGGGSLIDLGVHIIDLLRWLIGSSVSEVTAMTSRVAKPTFADDNAMVLMRFEDGVIASVQTGWTARPGNDAEIVIHGERGHVAFSRAFRPVLAVRLIGEEARAVEIPSGTDDPCTDFVSSIREQRKPFVAGADGRDTLAVALAAYESARTGRAVSTA